MTRNLAILGALAAFVTCGCAKHSDALPPHASTAAEPEPAAEDAGGPRLQRAPVVVWVDGPAQVQAGSELTLRVTIERNAGSDPLDLNIVLPAGAVLVSGQTQERITGDARHVERTLGLRLTGAIPAADLDVSVDSRGIGYGVHATSAYRFGRPEPKLPQPPRAGPPVMVRGQSVGNPIPLGP